MSPHLEAARNLENAIYNWKRDQSHGNTTEVIAHAHQLTAAACALDRELRTVREALTRKRGDLIVAVSHALGVVSASIVQPGTSIRVTGSRAAVLDAEQLRSLLNLVLDELKSGQT